ncbi:MAG: presenilin family intramembrane aspartyl protease PSH [Thermoplasmata archaeon]
MKKEHLSVVAIACMMVLTHMLALTVVNLYPEEYKAFGEDVDDPVNPLIYVGFLIVFTGALLLVMKYTKGNFLQYMILAVVALTMFYVFYPIYLTFIPYRVLVSNVWIDLPSTFAIVTTALLTALLYLHPEWYVINGLGLIMGAGIAAIFGFSLGILPVFVLLIALAAYDAISVYKTKHMLTLADGVMKMKTPVLLVFPTDMKYSFKNEEKKKLVSKKGKKSKGLDATFIGLGDMIIPGILPVSAFMYLEPITFGGLYGPLLVAFGSICGAVIGLTVLMGYVLKGNPQAGLPLLNSGVILGYIFSYVVVYGDFTFGLMTVV